MKKYLVVMMLLSGSICFSDVIVREDGTVYLGKVDSVTAESVSVNTFGSMIAMPTKRVAENHKTLDPFKSRRVSVSLKSGSEIAGTIDDYDDEIGLLLNIGFGTITIPVTSVSGVYDPAMEKAYSGFHHKIGAGVSGYTPLGSASGNYDNSSEISLFGEYMVPFARGLFAGADFTYRNIGYSASSDITYRQFALKPYLMYSFLDFKKITPLFSRLTPFAAAYAGPCYTSMNDDRPYVKESSRGEINLEAKGAVGCDILLGESFMLRLSGGYTTVFQKSEQFRLAGIGLSASFGF